VNIRLGFRVIAVEVGAVNLRLKHEPLTLWL